MGYFVYKIIRNLIESSLNVKAILINIPLIGSYCFTLGFTFVISNFYKFHIELVLKNSTTIENLDVEHAKENAKFCISYYENWIQVYGASKLFWFIPLDIDEAKPVGDGLNWPVKSEADDKPKINDFNSTDNKGINPSLELANKDSKYGSNINNYNSTAPLQHI